MLSCRKRTHWPQWVLMALGCLQVKRMHKTMMPVPATKQPTPQNNHRYSWQVLSRSLAAQSKSLARSVASRRQQTSKTFVGIRSPRCLELRLLVCLSTPRWEGLYRSRLALFTLDRPPGRGACSGMGGHRCAQVSATLYTDNCIYM
eukprot:COSAG02_NODE_20262_length_840_cov_1.412955_1_plen_146_part_00